MLRVILDALQYKKELAKVTKRVILSQTRKALMKPNVSSIQLRLVIPQALQRAGVAVYEKAADFFLERGCPVFVQEKLLKLSKSLPVIVEGEVTPVALEQFLCSFPEVDKLVILTSVSANNALRVAA